MESQSEKGALSQRIAPLWRPISLVGPAYTVKAPSTTCSGITCERVQAKAGDNLAAHAAIAEAPAGSVLVVQSIGNAQTVAESALLCDIMAFAAQQRSIVGLVTNAPIRDGAKLQAMNFPVFSVGRQVKGPAKLDLGERQIPVEVGGITISPGDYVVGDDDGVVVIQEMDVDAVISRLSSGRRMRLKC